MVLGSNLEMHSRERAHFEYHGLFKFIFLFHINPYKVTRFDY